MFLDESGDHRLKVISGTYPVFVLGGIIVERAYMRAVIEPRVGSFKRQFWSRENVVFHTVDMRNNADYFAFLTNTVQRETFYTELNAILDQLEFQVIAVAVLKEEFKARFPVAYDPYQFALAWLIDRFCDELDGEMDSGFICAEKRNRTLDFELLASWERFRAGDGTAGASSGSINDRIVGLELRDKSPNLAGMQLADLMVTPIGRHVRGRPTKPDQVQWSVVERKLRRVNDDYMDHGLMIRP